MYHCIHQHPEIENKCKFWEDLDNNFWVVHVEHPLWEEENDAWMQEIEEEHFFNKIMEPYGVVSTVIHEIFIHLKSDEISK